MELVTPQNIMFVIGLFGIAFGIYKQFNDPDVAVDKKAALLADQLRNTTELLNQRIESSQSGTDRRFKDVQDNFDKIWASITEHITSDAHKFETMNATQISMGKELVKIGTILDERLPLNRNSSGTKHKHG